MQQITTDLLLRAYAVGLFPMAESRDDPMLFWVDPHFRGILPLDSFHVPRRLRRTLRQERFEVRCDTAFAAVMQACAEATPDRPNTWINQEIVGVYVALFEQGHAHSVETWRDGKLVGGLYGVVLGSAFFGESMFSRESDASKVALAHLVARLRRGGFTLLDIQFLTDHLARLGGVEVPRVEYKSMLREALAGQATFPRQLDVPLEAALPAAAGS